MLRIPSVMAVCGLCLALSGCKDAADGEAPAATAMDVSGVRTVEVGCAMCTFDMEGVAGCQTAVKVGGQHFLAAGADVVDAHEADLCSSAKTAEVAGTIEDGKFIATSFALKP